MRSLIINRNRYIVEKNKRNTVIKRFSIFGFVLLLLGAAYIISINNKSVASGGGGTGVVVESEVEEKPNYKLDADENDGEESHVVELDSGDSKNNKSEVVTQAIPETYYVTRVVDGDTIYVDGIETRIRLIGVNTPETVDSSKPIQCYGPEASNYLSDLLLHKYVGLESDAASGDVDKYGRPLRYVYYNGENINQKLIQEGYGKEASYGSEYKYRSQFLESQNYAILNAVGLWSSATCNGQE